MHARIGLVGFLVGCGGVCDDVEQQAKDLVLEALDQPTSCDFASECVVVAVAGDCFDACTRIAHRDDAAAAERAIVEANDTICAAHPTCEPVLPPCVPPDVPVCLNNRCLAGAPAG